MAVRDVAMWRVTYSVTVEADNEEDAILRADEGKGGGHWEARKQGTSKGKGQAMSRIEGATPISNSEDVIDSRTVIARIEYLEAEEELDEDEQQELTALRELASEAEGYVPDWRYGVAALIRDDYFEDYAQEFAEQTGAVDASAPWPMMCIDWEKAARALRMDYRSVEFDGITYWVR